MASSPGTCLRPLKLVATDLDGTLLTSERTPAPEGARLLRAAARRGTRVVLATARNPDHVRPLCRLMELHDPIICTDGAQVWGSPDGPVWAYHTIPRAVALALARLADRHGWELSTTVGETTYLRQRPGQALGSLGPGLTVVPSNAEGVVGDAVRVIVWQPEGVEGVRALCHSRFGDVCHTKTFYAPDGSIHSLAVFPRLADKGTALALVLGRLGIHPRHVMAIGDNLNDVSMFAHARVRVAMGNAPPEVKQAANLVAPSNDEEGVAWALKFCGVGVV